MAIFDRQLWLYEWRLWAHSRTNYLCVLLLGLLCCAALVNGIYQQQRQNLHLDQVTAQHQQQQRLLMQHYPDNSDAGYIAYYTQHLTQHRPPALGFLATGSRDVQAYALRIRLLGLQGQLHETQNQNPEYLILGQFDFSFVLIYLTPLMILFLSHDLVNQERQARRLGLLLSLHSSSRVWWYKISLNIVAINLALLLPLLIALIWQSRPVTEILTLQVVSFTYIVFWSLVCSLLALAVHHAQSSIMLGLASYLCLLLIFPAILEVAVNRAQPLTHSFAMSLQQRQLIHQAWDQPRQDVMQAFIQHHPEWRDYATVQGRFHWKWYYAMHELSDMGIAKELYAYQQSLNHRLQIQQSLAFVLPGLVWQQSLSALTQTELQTHLSYLQKVSEYHQELREFFYPYFFKDQAFKQADQYKIPQFKAFQAQTQWRFDYLLSYLFICLVLIILTENRLRRIKL